MARPVRLLEHPPAPGAWNMAVDEALMAAARNGAVTLRLYRWQPACLSLGRNERARDRYDAAEAARRGIDVLRRPTGGRAVYHDDELTYAVAAPAGLWGGLRESYARINRALARGLLALGAPAATAPLPSGRMGGTPGRVPASRGSGPRPDGPSAQPGWADRNAGACFAAPAPGEVTADGRKLVGSAQWRESGALLQHGSILLTDGQRVVEALRRRTPVGSRAVGLEELLGYRPTWRALGDAIASGFRRELEAALQPGELTTAEREAARRLEDRYRADEWTWSR